MQTNVIGIVLYASTQLMGAPVGGFVAGSLSPAVVTGVSVGLSSVGFELMVLVSDERVFKRGDDAFPPLLLSVSLILVALGIVYSQLLSILCSTSFYGGDQTVYATGIVNTSYAVGAVMASVLFLLSDLTLRRNMMCIGFVQVAAWPLITSVVWWTTKGGASTTPGERCNTHACPADGRDPEDSPLLGHVLPISVIVNARPPALRGGGAVDSTEPSSFQDYLWKTVTSWRYYHAMLISACLIAIDSTFTTNLGSALAASLPPHNDRAADSTTAYCCPLMCPRSTRATRSCMW